MSERPSHELIHFTVLRHAVIHDSPIHVSQQFTPLFYVHRSTGRLHCFYFGNLHQARASRITKGTHFYLLSLQLLRFPPHHPYFPPMLCTPHRTAYPPPPSSFNLPCTT